MISSTFGAPFGGTTRAGQYGFEFFTSRSILPSNFCGGGGSCSPLIVVVALGEPGVPVVWMSAPCAAAKNVIVHAAIRCAHRPPLVMLVFLFCISVKAPQPLGSTRR